MSRKRIVVSLLLLVALSLGAACYLQLSRTTGNTVALATPAAPATITTESVPPVGGLEPGEALHLAAIVARGSAPAVIPVPTAEQAIAEDPALEVSTVTMETVDMPTQSIVLASAADSGEYQPRSTYARAGNFRFRGAGGFGGGGGAGRGGSGTPDQQPSDSSNTSDSNSPGSNASGSGEPEGNGPAGDTQEEPAPDETPPNSDTKDRGESTPPKKDDDKKDTQPPSVTDPDEGSPGEPPYEGPGETPEEKPVSVPDPSTMALLGAGLAALGLVRRRRTPQ